MYNNYYGNGGAYASQEQISRNMAQSPFRQAMAVAAQRMRLAKQALPNAAYQYAQQHLMNTPQVRREVNPHSIVANQNFATGGGFNPRYNAAAIAHDQMFEPAPGTIGPPGYPVFDNNNGMGVIAPSQLEAAHQQFPQVPPMPNMAQVTSNYQPVSTPVVNQRHFGSAFSQARQAGLKTFDFRGKSYTTDLRSDAGKQTAQKAMVSHTQTVNNNPIAAAIAHDQMFEPAPGTIGPPGYPVFDNNNGMGVLAPSQLEAAQQQFPQVPPMPNMAQVTSNYQPTPTPVVNQRHFGSAFSQARQAGLKTFDFRGKVYTTDLRSDTGKQTAQKAMVSHTQTVNNNPIAAAMYPVRSSNTSSPRPTGNTTNTRSGLKTALGAGATAAAGLGYWLTSTGAVKYPKGYMTPKEFVKDTKTKLASKYMTPKEALQSVKYPKGYMKPGEFTQSMVDKLKDLKYPKGYMKPGEFTQSMVDKLKDLKRPEMPKFTMPRFKTPAVPDIKFPRINVNNIPERIGTKAYSVPALKSSVNTADKVYKSLEKTSRKLSKRLFE